MKHLNCKLFYQQLHLKHLCNLARCLLQAVWRWHDSVETFRSVIICEIIVYLLVIVQNKKKLFLHCLVGAVRPRGEKCGILLHSCLNVRCMYLKLLVPTCYISFNAALCHDVLSCSFRERVHLLVRYKFVFWTGLLTKI